MSKYGIAILFLDLRPLSFMIIKGLCPKELVGFKDSRGREDAQSTYQIVCLTKFGRQQIELKKGE